MGTRPFNNDRSPKLSSDAGQGSPAMWPHDAEKKAQAVTELLRNKSLSHTFGQRGEYEVRTTITTRQAWRYRCCVRRDGKEVRREFCPVEVDFTRQLKQEMLMTDPMRVAFATGAVEDHFALCAAVREYVWLATIYSEPLPPYYRLWYITFVALMLAALVTTYWFWRDPSHAGPSAQPSANVPRRVMQWSQNPVFYEHPAGKRFTFRLPALTKMATGLPVEVTLDASGQRPHWIHFDREAWLISGTAPSTEQARTYQLIFRASAGDGAESRLQAYLTITPTMELLPPPAPPAPKPSAPDRLPEKDCLLNMLKGEPCQNR
jgi:putative Ig domain-containing protein